MAQKKGNGGTTAPGPRTQGNGGTTAPKSSNKNTTGLNAARDAKTGKQANTGGKKAPAAAPHAGETYNPGVKSPTISPFMTAEDIMDYSGARSAYEQQIHELDYGYEQTVANTGYEKGQITKGARQQGADSSDDFAARGLARSSVRDADMFDIDATAAMKKSFLDTNLNTLKLHTDTEKERLRSAWENPESGYLHGLDLKKVQNAQAAGAEAPEYSTEPGWTPNAAPATKPANKPAGQGGNKPPGSKPAHGPATAPPTKNGGTQAPKGSPNTGHVNAAKAIMGRNYL